MAIGALALIGAVGCTAEPEAAELAAGSGAATPTASPTAAVTGRENVAIRLNPERVTEGERDSVWVLANCPVPEGGPEHSGTATSDAFTRAVTLEPVPTDAEGGGDSGSSDAPSAPARGPWVRGEARVPGTIDRGTYEVSIKCEGTNDTGTAKLRVAKRPEVVPDRAPKAGGGGTAAGGGPQEESGMSLGTVALVGAAVAGGGAGFVAWRRRRT
ncbi:hypothetical protein [Sinosporangium album]|nr:hypothetical protein [Sinosporangium album]